MYLITQQNHNMKIVSKQIPEMTVEGAEISSMRNSGSAREEVAAGYRKLHSEEIHYVCSSTDTIRVTKTV